MASIREEKIGSEKVQHGAYFTEGRSKAIQVIPKYTDCFSAKGLPQPHHSQCHHFDILTWFCCEDTGDMKHNQRDDAKREELHRHKMFGRNLPPAKFKFLICDLLIRVFDEVSPGVSFPGLSLLSVLLKVFSVHLILDTNVS